MIKKKIDVLLWTQKETNADIVKGQSENKLYYMSSELFPATQTWKGVGVNRFSYSYTGLKISGDVVVCDVTL